MIDILKNYQKFINKQKINHKNTIQSWLYFYIFQCVAGGWAGGSIKDSDIF